MSEYTERDAQALDRAGGHYSRHSNAMTTEKLDSKSDIAAELAWRDMRIAELEAHRLAVAIQCGIVLEYEGQGVEAGPNHRVIEEIEDNRRRAGQQAEGAALVTRLEAALRVSDKRAAEAVRDARSWADLIEHLETWRDRAAGDERLIAEDLCDKPHKIPTVVAELLGRRVTQELKISAINQLEAQLVSADRYILHALAGTGICTPAEGFRKAGFNWAARGIEELAKQRDEAVARSGALETELLRTSIPVDDFDRSEEATE